MALQASQSAGGAVATGAAAAAPGVTGATSGTAANAMAAASIGTTVTMAVAAAATIAVASTGGFAPTTSPLFVDHESIVALPRVPCSEDAINRTGYLDITLE